MPVDQSGETIVFVLTNQNVEAHVQIEYQGDPERFAWLIPVPRVPEVEVGNQNFFTQLRNATVPTFTVNRTQSSCGGASRSSSGGCAFGGSSDSAATVVDKDAGASYADQDSEVVVSREVVGAFDVTILEPTNEAEIEEWLSANDFLNDLNAAPIVRDYVERDHVFVAVKLTPSAEVDEIHPLVLRYAGDEPCVPLKLTSIAAIDDMPIRVFFLGERRSVPLNYRHVELNPFRFDWPNVGSNYSAVLSEAVDGDGAEGRAFVTEYAGDSSVVPRGVIAPPQWTEADFKDVAAASVPGILTSQDLLDCTSTSNLLTDPALCTSPHPMVMPILRRYLPAPDGVAERLFYADTRTYEDAIDTEAWDLEAFTGDYAELVSEPARHAEDLLERFGHLTRLATVISPDEMTEDPIFVESSMELPDVSPRWVATREFRCDGPDELTVDDRSFALTAAGRMPFDDDLPAAATVTEFSPSGEEGVVTDNRDTTDDDIADAASATRGEAMESENGSCTIRRRPVSFSVWLLGGALLGFLARRRRR